MIENNFNNILNEAKKLHQNGNLISAINGYLKLIDSHNDNPELNFYLGTAYLQTGAYEKSIKYLEQSINNTRSNPMIYNNLGIAYKEIQEFEKAEENFNKALKIKKDFVQVYNNQGIIFRKLKKFDKSLKYLKKAIELNPNYFEAYNNIGNTLNDIGKKEKAIENYKKAIELNPKYLDAYLNIGTAYQELKKYDDAKKNYQKVKEIDPYYNFINGKLLHLNMNMCDWRNYDEETKFVENSVKIQNITDPFLFLSVSDDQTIQKKIAENYVKKFHTTKKVNILKTKGVNPKIAYFSPDFANHPVLHLMKDTFKNHDKKRFDIYGYSFGLKSKDETHFDIKKNFKSFNYIDDVSDKKVGMVCRNIGIDIAIDLCGHTAENRLGVFSERVSNIQINYLGYPGTLGADFMDYIIADKHVIPKDYHHKYTEKVLYLPNCYQSNPSEDIVSDKKLTRKDFKLPEDKFVFCSFNNHNKITPLIFKCWMKILNRAKESVLWLYVTNEVAKKNIISEAKNCGIDAKRVIFTENIKHSEHLKRLKLADIFLDTFPYNAHTTGSDAFRVGLPTITLQGKTFASRVLSSILYNNNLEELITKDLKSYENLAVNLVNKKSKFQKLKKKVNEKSKKSNLFDNIRFTRDLEKIYTNLLKT